MVNLASDVYLGSHYLFITTLEKRLESAVIDRMAETGGFCLPDFIKQNKSVYFAIDNIDILEETPFGQNTTHGTIIVISQEDDEDGQTINTPLHVPHRAASQELEIAYREEPVINQQSIKFETFELNEQSNLLCNMVREDHVWALGCYLSNNVNAPATNDDLTSDATHLDDDSDNVPRDEPQVNQLCDGIFSGQET